MTFLIKVPGFRIAIIGTDEDWSYLTEPCPHACLGMKENRCALPRGKTMGGTGAINGMSYVRGIRKDYDDWAAAGNTGWDYDSVFPYFLKSEKMLDPDYVNSSNHATTGLLPLIKSQFAGPIRNAILNASEDFGYGLKTDEGQLGFIDGFQTIENGERVTTSKAFISRTQPRPNLHIAYNSQVMRVIFSKGKAEKIQVRVGKTIKWLRATKEYILSAGTINTPQILLNSGVGPSKHLKRLGIPEIKNLPVGENLQHHFTMPSIFLKLQPSSLTVDPNPINPMYNYFMNRKGPLSNNNAFSFTGFINTKGDSPFPNLQLHHYLHGKNNTAMFGKYMQNIRYLNETAEDMLDAVVNYITLNIVPTLLKPKSRGKVQLRSKNPFDKPLIYTNYLGDPNGDDLNTLLEGTRFVLELARNRHLAPYIIDVMDVKMPNCRGLTFDSDDYWRCAIKNLGDSVGDFVGTCKMGPASDPSAVVAPNLKLHSFKNIRIIDASVMPNIISGNTNTPTVMIAEKGADLIKNEHYQA